jgi:hypothetical protein
VGASPTPQLIPLPSTELAAGDGGKTTTPTASASRATPLSTANFARRSELLLLEEGLLAGGVGRREGRGVVYSRIVRGYAWMYSPLRVK